MNIEPQTITIEQAYAEACRALGEAVVMQRLMAAELARLQATLSSSDIDLNQSKEKSHAN